MGLDSERGQNRLMFPRVLCGSAILWLLIGCVGFASVLAPQASAQHMGGHVGGGGARVSPPIPQPPISRPPVSRPFSPVPPVGAFRPGGSVLFRPGPFRPRPIYPYPIYRYPIYGYPVWGPQWQFWWQWAVWPHNSCAWTNCYFWNWGPSYDSFRFYEYTPAYVGTPAYPSSLYLSAQEREQPQLFLTDGTAYSVTDYWLVDNQVHFKIVDERSGNSVEQVIPLDALDLQTTVDVNTRRGFRFVLRNEPMDQYLEHHPDQPPPDWTPPHP